MVKRGPDVEEMTASKSVRQKRRTMMKIQEERAPRNTAKTMVRGALMLGPGRVARGERNKVSGENLCLRPGQQTYEASPRSCG